MWIEDLIAYYEKKDDVSQKEFLRAIIFKVNRDDLSLPSEVKAFLQSDGMQFHQIVKASSHDQLCSGPYVLSHGLLMK